MQVLLPRARFKFSEHWMTLTYFFLFCFLISVPSASRSGPQGARAALTRSPCPPAALQVSGISSPWARPCPAAAGQRPAGEPRHDPGPEPNLGAAASPAGDCPCSGRRRYRPGQGSAGTAGLQAPPAPDPGLLPGSAGAGGALPASAHTAGGTTLFLQPSKERVAVTSLNCHFHRIPKAPAILCLKSLPYFCWKLGCVFLTLFREEADNIWWLSQPVLQWVLLLHPSYFSLSWVKPLPSVACNSCFSPFNPLSLPRWIKVVLSVMGCGTWAEASQCAALTLRMDTQPGDSPGGTVTQCLVCPALHLATTSWCPPQKGNSEAILQGIFGLVAGQGQDVAQGLLPSFAVWLFWGPGDTSEGSGWSPSSQGYYL